MRTLLFFYFGPSQTTLAANTVGVLFPSKSRRHSK